MDVIRAKFFSSPLHILISVGPSPSIVSHAMVISPLHGSNVKEADNQPQREADLSDGAKTGLVVGVLIGIACLVAAGRYWAHGTIMFHWT
jgi:hypothetical protein